MWIRKEQLVVLGLLVALTLAEEAAKPSPNCDTSHLATIHPWSMDHSVWTLAMELDQQANYTNHKGVVLHFKSFGENILMITRDRKGAGNNQTCGLEDWSCEAKGGICYFTSGMEVHLIAIENDFHVVWVNRTSAEGGKTHNSLWVFIKNHGGTHKNLTMADLSTEMKSSIEKSCGPDAVNPKFYHSFDLSVAPNCPKKDHDN